MCTTRPKAYSYIMQRTAFSVLVPAYNEGALLARSLETISITLERLRERYDCELIVVDDGSSDETATILATAAAADPIGMRVLTHERNRGLTAALQTACEAARNNVVVVLDADLSYNPDIVEPLVKTLLRRGAAAVLASPYMSGGAVRNVPLGRLLASRAANCILSLCAAANLHTFTGMVRAYDASVFRELLGGQPSGEFNAWATSEMLSRGLRVEEIPAALVWPVERATGPGRLSMSQLLHRVGLVFASGRALWKARRAVATGRTGTLVLSTQPGRPYSPR